MSKARQGKARQGKARAPADAGADVRAVAWVRVDPKRGSTASGVLIAPIEP